MLRASNPQPNDCRHTSSSHGRSATSRASRARRLPGRHAASADPSVASAPLPCPSCLLRRHPVAAAPASSRSRFSRRRGRGFRLARSFRCHPACVFRRCAFACQHGVLQPQGRKHGEPHVGQRPVDAVEHGRVCMVGPAGKRSGASPCAPRPRDGAFVALLARCVRSPAAPPFPRPAPGRVRPRPLRGRSRALQFRSRRPAAPRGRPRAWPRRRVS